MRLFQKPSIAIQDAKQKMLDLGQKFETENWQSVKAPDAMLELLNHSLKMVIPQNLDELVKEVKPNMPWAADHFLERVGGKPINPGKEYANWPFYKRNKANDKFRTVDEKFSHTYMERIWTPKFDGIRYESGNFGDVVNQLADDPTTRQAFLPIWFPEDTGAVHKERVPCTLGYHFIMRYDYIHIVYYIRSCDYLRHFRDDIYLAIRKLYWVLEKLQEKDPETWNKVKPGTLTMHITSLHCFWTERTVLNMKNK